MIEQVSFEIAAEVLKDTASRSQYQFQMVNRLQKRQIILDWV